MNFVNRAYAQLVELFRSMTVGARVATAALLTLVVISLVYLFQYQVAGGDEFLLDGRPFSSSELKEIETAFAKAGLGQSTVAGNRIRIPRGKKEVYLAALADGNALPADFYKYLDEATSGESPFASKQSLELRRWNAKQKELALIIGRMRGIDAATVQYDEEVKRGLIQEKQKTAMVAVQSSGRLEDDQIRAIRNVVASAYAGLDRRQITITDMTTGFSYGGAIGPDGVAEDESLYATHKQKYERDWQQKIAQQLSMIPGVIVGVNVELSPEIENSANLVKYDPKPVTVATTEYNKDATLQAPLVSGRPGAQSNGVQGNTSVSLQQANANGPQSQTTESRSTNQNVPGFEQRMLKNASLVPTRVTASIEVPASYFVSIWKQRHPPAEGQPPKPPDPAEVATIETETKNRIKETVHNLLPRVIQGTDPWPHINVQTYTDMPVPAANEPTLAKAATTWLAGNWQTLALVAIGLVSLAMLRSMVRSPWSPSPGVAAAVAEQQPRLTIHEPPADEAETEPARALKRRFTATGPDLRAELQEIVKENPDAAASILRSWIGDAV
jgi:flagellar M-ring protein FliF